MAQFLIRVNRQPFTLWNSATVRRSIDEVSGSFRFTSTNAPLNGYPVKPGDLVEILINEETKIKGYVDKIEVPMSTSTHNVTVSGRDNVQDLIDSSLRKKEYEGGISFKTLCEQVISSLGADIPVIDNSGGVPDFTLEEAIDIEVSSKAMEFLVSFARKRNVFLVSDGKGSLVIYKPTADRKATTPLLNLEPIDSRNNIKSRSFRLDYSKRFHEYRAASSDNFGFNVAANYSGDGIQRSGTAIDDNIRSSRYTEIICEEIMDDEECSNRVKEESNVIRTRSTVYSAVVADVAMADGTLWDYGYLVRVTDDPAGIRGWFFIRSVEYKMDITSGSQTTIVCGPPDAYKVTAVPDAIDARKAIVAGRYLDESFI